MSKRRREAQPLDLDAFATHIGKFQEILAMTQGQKLCRWRQEEMQRALTWADYIGQTLSGIGGTPELSALTKRLKYSEPLGATPDISTLFQGSCMPSILSSLTRFLSMKPGSLCFVRLCTARSC